MPEEEADEDAWVVKGSEQPPAAMSTGMSIVGSAVAAAAGGAGTSRGESLAGALASRDRRGGAVVGDEDEEDEDVGPQLPVDASTGGNVKYDSKAYVLGSPSLLLVVIVDTTLMNKMLTFSLCYAVGMHICDQVKEQLWRRSPLRDNVSPDEEKSV